jgi:hypothetical protein
LINELRSGEQVSPELNLSRICPIFFARAGLIVRHPAAGFSARDTVVLAFMLSSCHQAQGAACS